MYISFLGTRATIIEDMLGISADNFFFPDCGEVLDFWKNGININEELSDLISESILLYTFSFIGNKSILHNKKTINNPDAVSLIKKFIDDNLSNPKLSLELISKTLNYNKKYISTAFKKQIKVGFSEYLNTVRIQYACTMIQQGYTSINDISRLCGYSDSHYFSNVFKKKMHISPKAYVCQIQSNKKEEII